MRKRVSDLVRMIVWSEDVGRVRATWRVLFPVVAGFVAFALSGAVATSLGVNRGQMMVASFTVTALASVGILLVSATYLDDRPIPAYGYHVSRRWILDLLVGVGLGFTVVAMTVLVARRAGTLTVTGAGSFADGPFLAWLMAFVVAFVFVSFYEELLYRGLFITNAIEGLSARGWSQRTVFVATLLGSSAAFSLAHLPSALAQGADVGLYALKNLSFGVLLALPYLLTGELATSMGLHLGVNVAQINVFGIGSTGVEGIPVIVGVEAASTGLWSPTAGIPMIAASLVGSVLVIAWCHWRRTSPGVETRPLGREVDGNR